RELRRVEVVGKVTGGFDRLGEPLIEVGGGFYPLGGRGSGLEGGGLIIRDPIHADHGDHDGKKCGPCKCKGCCHYDKCYEYCSGDSGPCCKWGKCHSCCS
uniref:Uncharacterized protein n=1 Tax=Oryza meridionalis TaxID=40149 RepID=A0A0E0CMK3_9ORYZ